MTVVALTTTVLLVAHPADEHADAVERGLRARGTRVIRFSRQSLPGNTFSWRPDGGATFGRDKIGPSGGYWRRPSQPDASAYRVEFQRFVETECRDAFDGAIKHANIRWLSDPEDVERAELKLIQLRTAEQLGIPIPPTLVTNSANQAVRFAKEHQDVVVKPTRYGLVSTAESRPLVAWTAVANTTDLAKLSGAPVIVQAKVPAWAHVRIVTVSMRAFVSELRCTQLDWRSSIDNHRQFVRVENPEVGLVSSAMSLCREMHLGYSSQDWIIDLDGKAWFLDLNPSGQWLFVDASHRGAITRSLVRELQRTAEEALVSGDSYGMA